MKNTKITTFAVFSIAFVYIALAPLFTYAQSGTFTCTSVLKDDLRLHDTGIAVTELQKILNLSRDTQIALTGPGSPGNESDYSGMLTYKAVVKFQEKYAKEILTPAGLTKGTGFVGLNTRVKLSSICSQLSSLSTISIAPTVVSTTITNKDQTAATWNGFARNYDRGRYSKKTPVTGICGIAQNICSAGTFGDTTDSATNFLWNCFGKNGGTGTSCSITKPVVTTTPTPAPTPTPTRINGQCGTTQNICIKGLLSDGTDSTAEYLWSCLGQNNGATASCALTKPIITPNPDITAPSIPTNLYVSAITTSGITFKWASSTDASVNQAITSGITNYRIYRCTGTSCSATTQIGTATNMSYEDSSLSADTSYRYRVRAIDNTGNLSSYSSSLTAKTHSLPPSPTNGVCSTTVNICTTGTFSDLTDLFTNYLWQCLGLNGGTTASCSLTIPTTPPPTPSSSLLWGAFTGYSSSELTAFEQLVGKPVNIRAVFVNWGDSFPTSFGSNLKGAGKTMLIFWEQYGVTLDSIIAGEHDTYIKQFSDAAKSYGGQVILSPLHEMNGDWDPWGGTVGANTPAKVIATWKRIHDQFGTVSNVKFAWAMNNVSVPNTSANAISQYYPGDNYLDYVAIDGFNFGNPWQSFTTVFDSALKLVAPYNKPIYILSTASAAGSSKAGWITDFGIQIKKYPLLKGFVWFNENKEEDWRVNSDSASLEAFKAILP